MVISDRLKPFPSVKASALRGRSRGAWQRPRCRPRGRRDTTGSPLCCSVSSFRASQAVATGALPYRLLRLHAVWTLQTRCRTLVRCPAGRPGLRLPFYLYTYFHCRKVVVIVIAQLHPIWSLPCGRKHPLQRPTPPASRPCPTQRAVGGLLAAAGACSRPWPCPNTAHPLPVAQ